MPRDLLENLHQGYFRGWVPLFFSILLFLNGVIAIVIAIIPFLNEAFSTSDEGHFFFFLIKNQTNAKVNTMLFLIAGYVLLLIGRGIYRRLRISWCLALLLLIILLINNLFILSRVSYLSWVYAIEIFGLLICYKCFNEKASKFLLTYTQMIVAISFILIFLYGVVGSYILRSQFVGINSWVDAIYFTIVTYSTVGYGDIYPNTENARLFVMTMIFVGLGAFAAMLTFLVGTFVNRIQHLLQSFNRGIKKMKNHTVICGLNNLTLSVVSEFDSAHNDYIITDSKSNFSQEDNNTQKTIIYGDVSRTSFLHKLHVNEAKSIIIAYEKDAYNILALLSIKAFLSNKKVKIITRINDRDNIDKAYKLGSDEVVSPLVMATDKIIGSL
jgi:voltage-gated potassium channel